MGEPTGQDYKQKAAHYGGQVFDFGKAAAASTNEKDIEIWELVRDLPALQGIWPYVCFLLNFFIPGVGTMLCACLGDPKAWSKT